MCIVTCRGAAGFVNAVARRITKTLGRIGKAFFRRDVSSSFLSKFQGLWLCTDFYEILSRCMGTISLGRRVTNTSIVGFHIENPPRDLSSQLCRLGILGICFICMPSN